MILTMKDFSEVFMFVFYTLFGTVLGFLIFLCACGGWEYVFLGRSTKPWNGLFALIILCGLGSGWGFVSYKYKNREFGSRSSVFYSDPASAALFTKRLMVIATCLVGAYFIWQLARSM